MLACSAFSGQSSCVHVLQMFVHTGLAGKGIMSAIVRCHGLSRLGFFGLFDLPRHRYRILKEPTALLELLPQCRCRVARQLS